MCITVCIIIILSYYYTQPGCVFYELITLKRCFEGKSLQELIFNIVKGTFTLPTDCSPEIASALKAMLNKVNFFFKLN